MCSKSLKSICFFALISMFALSACVLEDSDNYQPVDDVGVSEGSYEAFSETEDAAFTINGGTFDSEFGCVTFSDLEGVPDCDNVATVGGSCSPIGFECIRQQHDFCLDSSSGEFGVVTSLLVCR